MTNEQLSINVSDTNSGKVEVLPLVRLATEIRNDAASKKLNFIKFAKVTGTILITLNSFLIYKLTSEKTAQTAEINEIDNSLLVGDIDISEDYDEYVKTQNVIAQVAGHVADEALGLYSSAKEQVAALATSQVHGDIEDEGRGGIDHAISIAEFYRETLNDKKTPKVKIKKSKTLSPEFNSKSTLSSTPIGSPVVGKITSRFGRRYSPFTNLPSFHTGIDISIPEGTPVVASADGIVKFSGRKGAYGKAVHILHPNGKETIYAHLSSVKVIAGREIKRGETIGRVGSTGQSTGPHLHYEVLENGRPVNPEPYIKMASLVNKKK